MAGVKKSILLEILSFWDGIASVLTLLRVNFHKLARKFRENSLRFRKNSLDLRIPAFCERYSLKQLWS